MVYRIVLKPFFDVLFAVVLMVLFSPLTLTIYILLVFDGESEPIFKQERPGFKGRVFILYKFRTMRDIPEFNDKIDKDELRLTKLGRFIRKYSIDELPQLYSIVKGDMSFVGPRPLLLRYLPLYNEFQMQRHNVKPGITGWAQINGRNNSSWKKRFEDDVWYVENQSFFLDVKILIKTVYLVIMAKDVNKKGNATMEEFKGN